MSTFSPDDTNNVDDMQENLPIYYVTDTLPYVRQILGNTVTDINSASAQLRTVSKNSTNLYYGDSSGNIYIMDLNGVVTKTISTLLATIISTAINYNGSTLYFATQKKIYSMDTSSNEYIPLPNYNEVNDIYSIRIYQNTLYIDYTDRGCQTYDISGV
jgi:hypothetical protein